ncbi:sulfate/molybdate ABC transporter ATP-binding protein [Teichococcus aestuarii]|uniref:sulfate/molybdate ABC transporter ATP-binding protein n=1 Tax=Teichococcus aestuarii TaxID=568898 RepID=UPI00360BCD38
MSVAVRGLTRRFGPTAALRDIALETRPGEFVALLGPSGSGKTTLLRILAGLDFADSGTVEIEGQDMSAVPARARRLGFVFQNYALFRHMSVFENVAFGLRVRPRAARPGEAEIGRRVRALLERMQIGALERRMPEQISGGQRQRVALARALAIEPRLLLLDEPFGALDAEVRKGLRRWLRDLHTEMGLTSLFVTHDQEEALELADRVAVMEAGRLVQIDTPERLVEAPATAFVAGFLGHAARLPGRLAEGALHFEGCRCHPCHAPPCAPPRRRTGRSWPSSARMNGRWHRRRRGGQRHPAQPAPRRRPCPCGAGPRGPCHRGGGAAWPAARGAALPPGAANRPRLRRLSRLPELAFRARRRQGGSSTRSGPGASGTFTGRAPAGSPSICSRAEAPSSRTAPARRICTLAIRGSRLNGSAAP